MHNIKPCTTTITAFWRNGYVEHFASPKEVLARYGPYWVAQHVGREFRMYSHTCWFNADGVRLYFAGEWRGQDGVYPQFCYKDFDCILRNDRGEPVTYANLLTGGHRPGTRKRPPADLYRRGDGPVAGTGKRRGGYRHGREVRHAATLRASVTFHEDGEVAVRPKRRLDFFPDYDDYLTPLRRERNWKRYRKTQWKVRQ